MTRLAALWSTILLNNYHICINSLAIHIKTTQLSTRRTFRRNIPLQKAIHLSVSTAKLAQTPSFDKLEINPAPIKVSRGKPCSDLLEKMFHHAIFLQPTPVQTMLGNLALVPRAGGGNK